MAKARDAFRTISEVSDWLDTPAHVLRFWESKFSQVKPVKRAGGRRYYRPQDMALLAGIKTLLHEQGMTIKGAQKLLREQGVKHVAGLADKDPAASADTPAAVARTSKPVAAEPVQVSEPAPPAKPTEDAPPAPALETVVAFTAMPPATLPPAGVSTAAQATKPTPEPILPREAATPAEPRIFAALRDANDTALRAKAAQIAPLVQRLETLRDRMRQS